MQDGFPGRAAGNVPGFHHGLRFENPMDVRFNERGKAVELFEGTFTEGFAVFDTV